MGKWITPVLGLRGRVNWENVIRVKAAVKNFKKETNMIVNTEDILFYTFNVKYAKEPLMLNI